MDLFQKIISASPSSNFVRILYIDQDYQVRYWIIRNGSKIISEVTLAQAIELLNSVEFDLILSEPHNLAVMKKKPDRTANVA